MAGRPHAGPLRPGVPTPTAQLHQPPRWFQVSNYPRLLYLPRIEHSPAPPRGPNHPSFPFLVAFSLLRELDSQGEAKLQLQLSSSPAPAPVLVPALVPPTAPARILHVTFFLLVLIRHALRLLLHPRLAGSLPCDSGYTLSGFSFLKWAAGLEQVRPGQIRSGQTRPDQTCQMVLGSLGLGAIDALDEP